MPIVYIQSMFVLEVICLIHIYVPVIPVSQRFQRRICMPISGGVSYDPFHGPPGGGGSCMSHCLHCMCPKQGMAKSEGQQQE